VRSSDWMTGKGPDCVQIYNTWGMGRHLAPWMAETGLLSLIFAEFPLPLGPEASSTKSRISA